MEPRLNLRGPSRKAKYSLMTDSELSRVTERWKEPLLGEVLNLKPSAYKRSEHYDLFSVTACLLHNDPASYCLRQAKALRATARGKPSLNRANYCRK